MCTVILYNELGYSSLNSIQCTSFKNKRNTGNKRIRRDTFWTVLLHFIHLKMLEPVPMVSFANFWGLLATVHFEIQLDFIDRKIVWWRQQNCRWRNKFQLKNWKLRSDQYDIAERNTVLCDFAISRFSSSDQNQNAKFNIRSLLENRDYGPPSNALGIYRPLFSWFKLNLRPWTKFFMLKYTSVLQNEMDHVIWFSLLVLENPVNCKGQMTEWRNSRDSSV